MDPTLPLLSLLVGAAWLVAVFAWRRRRRALLLVRLQQIARELGFAVGEHTRETSEFVGFEGGQIVLRVGERRVGIDLLEALEAQAEADPGRRLVKVRWLVSRALDQG